MMVKYQKLILYVIGLFLFLEYSSMSMDDRKYNDQPEKYTKESVLEKIRDDKIFLLEISNAIISREQDQLHIIDCITKKHGNRSYDIWKNNFSIEMTWGPNWDSVGGELQDELIKTFGSKDNAKMIMKREDFVLASNSVLEDPLSYAKIVIEKGTPEISIASGNSRAPYGIVIKYNFNSNVGEIYKKTSGITSSKCKDLTSMYIAFNITDILEQISKSKKVTWEEKVKDWNKSIKGYIATFTPTD